MNFEMYISLGKYLHTMNEADAFPMRTICRAIAVPQSKTYRDEGRRKSVYNRSTLPPLTSDALCIMQGYRLHGNTLPTSHTKRSLLNKPEAHVLVLLFGLFLLLWPECEGDNVIVLGFSFI